MATTEGTHPDSGSPARPAPRARLLDLDVGKGLAICLVVAGHIVARKPFPAGNEWYPALKHAIYTFHMAFFLYLAGVTFAISFAKVRSWNGYGAFVKKKALRLVPGYLTFSLLVLVAKLLAAKAGMHVDNMPSGLHSILSILFFPTQSYCEFLWFIYVLFLYYLTMPPLLFASKGRAGLAAALFLALSFFQWPPLFALNKYIGNAAFFLIGYVVWENHASVMRVLDRYKAAFLLAFAVALAFNRSLPSQIVALLALPALHALARTKPLATSRLLAAAGVLSYSIYLMNTLSIGFIKALLFKFSGWNGANFYWFFPALFLAGLLLPVAVKKGLLARIPLLDRYY